MALITLIYLREKKTWTEEIFKMYIPKGMTENEVLDVMTKVCDRIAPKYKFYGYSPEDMKQEAFIICIEALEKYDEKRPLENFLSFILPGRLINVIRNNHFAKGSKEDKKRVAMPGQLSGEGSLCYYETFLFEKMDVYELFNHVDNLIPMEYRSDYLKLLNEVYIDKKSKDKVVEVIKEIAATIGYVTDEDQ
jgi:hypothetical protein